MNFKAEYPFSGICCVSNHNTPNPLSQHIEKIDFFDTTSISLKKSLLGMKRVTYKSLHSFCHEW